MISIRACLTSAQENTSTKVLLTMELNAGYAQHNYADNRQGGARTGQFPTDPFVYQLY